jgi:omega-6 fatty acid desaturase (delta-12 desaturase)
MQGNADNRIKDERTWEKIVLRYAHPVLRKSIWQICDTLVPFIIIWYLLYRSLEYPYWITFLLTLVECGFLIRIFIIFHDCGHGSFFKSSKANTVVGAIMGIIAFTPFHVWHHQHSIHHATSANLDKRGIGDVWTMTVEEYISSSKSQRFVYRAFRNPFIMFTIGPMVVLWIRNRFSRKSMTRKEKSNIYLTNISIAVISFLICLLTGVKAFLIIQLPLVIISHSMGLWLFFIQHQFNDVSWERADAWDYKTAAITGSSFLKLPAILQWFTGNIGFHHVHHLSSRIPNYRLADCHYENDIFKEVKPLRLRSTFRVLFLSLWDEAKHRLISFRAIRSLSGSIT